MKSNCLRRTFNIIILICFACSLAAQSTYIVDISQSKKAVMLPVTLEDVEWTDGFWDEQYDQAISTTLRKLWELAADPDAGHVLDNFRAAASGEGEHAGTNWQDAWLYKWIEAASAAYAYSGESWINEHIDEAVSLIARAQQEDGYISTQITIPGKERFTDPREHEVYVMGHLLTAACIHRRITGENTLFDVAVRTADFLCETLGTKISPSFAHNPSAIMGLVEMYRESGNEDYLKCASLIVDSRGSTPKPGGIFSKGPGIIGTDLIQDRVPLRESTEVVGHNVFFTYLYAGATDIYLETGDESLLTSVERLWNDLTTTKMSINGGVSPMGHGLSKGKDPVVEAVGASYNLPAADSYNETCGQVGNFMWNYRMLTASGDAKYADIMELELYNGFLGGIGLDGKSWFYRNSLKFHEDSRHIEGGHNFLAERVEPGRKRICCPTNLLRTMTELQSYFYSTDAEGLWIHHYGGNTLSTALGNGDAIKLTQVTDYPWEGKVTLKLEEVPANNDYTIRMRIPGWASNVSVKINGKKLNETMNPGSYVSLTRKWAEGDVIELNIPMPGRLMEAHPRVEQSRNQVAIMRGPILYCLESIDLPDEKHIDNVRIPSDMKLKVTGSGLPFGIKNLEGKALYQEVDSWDRTLYRPLGTSIKMSKLPVSLIPYFSWNNRGQTAMSVWLPLEMK